MSDLEKNFLNIFKFNNCSDCLIELVTCFGLDNC